MSWILVVIIPGFIWSTSFSTIETCLQARQELIGKVNTAVCIRKD